MFDYHIHSDYSDSDQTLKQILNQARQRNLEAIALTDHDCVLEDGVHLDCGAIIKGSRIPEGERISCGMAIENQKELRKG